MSFELRYYQQEAVEAVRAYWRKGGGNPLVDIATGGGKSIIIAELVRELHERFQDFRTVMLVHNRELVEQNFKALLRLWPDAPVGIYSAGLNRRDAHHRITFASIQSVYKRAEILGPRQLVLVDECHLIPAHGQGMYRRLLTDLEHMAEMRVCGFSATPYRLDSGRLDQGEGTIFDETVYSYSIAQGIKDGYLCPLISKASASEVNVTDVQRRGGEFVSGSLEAAAMDDKLTASAVEETIRYGTERRSWLVFCSGVRHALKVRDAFRARGISCETVSGETHAGERRRILQAFKAGQIRCLTNANILTTGFDAPQVDMISMLRPTLSTGLYVQVVGRGVRLAAGKENCLVLDFAGNVRRHGPVDEVSILPKHKPKSDEQDEVKTAIDSVRAKSCPECKTLAALNTRFCKECDYEWPYTAKPSHEGEADGKSGILSTERIPPQVLGVVSWSHRRHQKIGSPDSLRVNYIAGISQYSEWVGLEHDGSAQQKAHQWWVTHSGRAPFPKTVDEALDRIQELTMPATIAIKPRGRYFDIVGRSFHKRKEEAAA